MAEAEIVVRSPFDGSEVGRVKSHSAAETDSAVARAVAVRKEGVLPLHERAAILDRAARALAARTDDLARTIASEAAKPIRTARVEAERAVSTFTFAAVEARKLAGEMVPIDASEAGAGKLAFTLRVPIGVVGGITPFNFPLNLVAHKVAPAIAAGCPIVVKPASQTPLSALALREVVVDECGLPGDWFQVVAGSASEVGEALVEHPEVAYLSFTGSGPVGWKLREKAPRKRVNLELGNSSPVIIDEGARWEEAADKIAVAGYSHAGQSCISTQRVYVHSSLASTFTERLAGLVEGLVVGDPLDEETDVSALISTDDRDRVKQWIDEAVHSGAVVEAGGRLVDGLLRPTLLSNTTPDMKVCREEVFGPVVAIQTYDDFDDAISLAGATDYGLQAAVFTPRIDRALAAAHRLDFGGVMVNEVPTFRADQMPYGGTNESGNTREGPAWAVREMTEERLVVIEP